MNRMARWEIALLVILAAAVAVIAYMAGGPL